MKRYGSTLIFLSLIVTIFLGYFFRFDKIILSCIFLIVLYVFISTKKYYVYISLGILIGIISLFRFEYTTAKFKTNLDNKFFNVKGVVTKTIPKNDYSVLHIKNTIIDNTLKGPNLYAYYYGCDSLKIGDIIEFSNKLFIPKNKKIPGRFNFYNYLITKDLHAYSYIHDVKLIGKSKSTVFKLQRLFDDFILSNVEKFDEDIKTFLYSSSTGRLIINEDLKNDFRQLGISHIMSISGFHIIIIYSIMLFIMRNLLIKMNYRKIIALTVVFFYCLLIDFPFSTIRAFIFLLVDTLSYFFMAPTDNKNTLALSALIIILINPFAVFDIGFILSFMAVFGITYIFPIIKHKDKKDKSLINIIYFLISINVAILPIQLYFFKEFSPYIILGNILVIPILTIILYLFILYLFLSFIPNIGYIIQILITFLFRISSYVILGIKSISELDTLNVSINIVEMLLYYSILIIFIIIYRNRYQFLKTLKKQYSNILIILLFSCAVNLFIYFQIPKGQIIMIDIGQGDCFIIRQGSNNYLIDTGGKLKENNNSKVVLENLSYYKIKKLNGIFLSHLDVDHIGNIKYILEKYPNTTIYSHIGSNDFFKDKLGHYKYFFKELKKGDCLINKHIKIQVLNSLSNEDENDNSLVLLLNVNGVKTLFTGDITNKTEKKLLTENCKSDILKISHHGSKTSSTEEFLKYLKPKIALISVGEYNTYNHPDYNLIENLNNKGISTKRTDVQGNCYIDIYDNYFMVYSSKEYIKNQILKTSTMTIIFYYAMILYVMYFLSKFEKRCSL